jgi:hypothetical protein
MHHTSSFICRATLLFLALGLFAPTSQATGTAPILPPLATDGFVLIDSLEALRHYAAQANVKVRLKPGIYQLDQASSRNFVAFTGADSHYDLTGATIRVDTDLFRRFGIGGGAAGIYCVFALAGDRIKMEGGKFENYGDKPGIQSRNKIFNITGTEVVLRNVDITTSGSSPWGYGSLYGISGGDVRKMNGIRVGWPAKGVRLIGCRVHMRAMGHAIFIQGAQDTVIEDCHVDGLLRPTNEILAETSGYAFDHKFTTSGRVYVEGVYVGADGKILPGEMVSLSEDGIRMYDQSEGHPTGSTTIVNCTVRQMRRGICTGLSPAADRVVNCEVHDCVAAGFNVGSGDVLERCRADAKYSEALCLASSGSQGAVVDLEVLDSRGGLANRLLAVINGHGHQVTLHTKDPAFIPPGMTVELASRNGYAFYQRGEPVSKANHVTNETPATVVVYPGGSESTVTSTGPVEMRFPAR